MAKNKERAIERMRKNSPDRNYEDEEELFGAVNDDYDKYEADLAKANETSNKLNEMLSTDPRSAAFLSAWHQGKNPVLSFIEEYGEDIVADITNPANKAKIEESSKKYLERLAKSKELDDIYEKNIEESRSLYDAMINEGEYSAEEIDGALDKLEQICGDFIAGKISKENIIAMIKSNGYDNAVAEASQEGEIRGRNTNIAKSRKMAAKGDGMPNTAGGNGKVAQTQEQNPQLGALNRYGKGGRRSIWDED